MKSTTVFAFGLLVIVIATPVVQSLKCWGPDKENSPDAQYPCVSYSSTLDTSKCVEKVCQLNEECIRYTAIYKQSGAQITGAGGCAPGAISQVMTTCKDRNFCNGDNSFYISTLSIQGNNGNIESENYKRSGKLNLQAAKGLDRLLAMGLQAAKHFVGTSPPQAASAVQPLKCWGHDGKGFLSQYPCMSYSSKLDTSKCIEKVCKPNEECMRMTAKQFGIQMTMGGGCTPAISSATTTCKDKDFCNGDAGNTLKNMVAYGLHGGVGRNSGMSSSPKMFLAVVSVMAAAVLRFI